MSQSHEDIEQRIRERAHALWEAAGRPEGRHKEFWDRARDQMEAGDEQPTGVIPKPPPAPV